MNKVNRWDYWFDTDGFEQWDPDPKGRWCKSEDVERLEAERDELLGLVDLVYGSFGGGLVMTFCEADVERFRAAIEKAKGVGDDA